MAWEGVDPREDLLDMIRAYDCWKDPQMKASLDAERALVDLSQSAKRLVTPYWARYINSNRMPPTPPASLERKCLRTSS